MNKTIASLVCVVLLVAGSIAHAEPARDTGSSASLSATSIDPPTRIGPHFSFGLHGTVFNAYNRGNLDTWFGEMTGDPGRQVDQGSPAYFNVDATMYFPLQQDVLMAGASMGFSVPPSHSLWGTYLFFGGRDEIELMPMVMSVGMPFRYQVGTTGKFYAIASPQLLMGWVTGTYTSSSFDLNFTPSPSMGFGMSVGGEAMFSDIFGVNFTMGYRALKVDLVYEDAGSSTGYSQPLLNNGEEVQVDLSGSFMTIGVTLHH